MLRGLLQTKELTKDDDICLFLLPDIQYIYSSEGLIEILTPIQRSLELLENRIFLRSNIQGGGWYLRYKKYKLFNVPQKTRLSMHLFCMDVQLYNVQWCMVHLHSIKCERIIHTYNLHFFCVFLFFGGQERPPSFSVLLYFSYST